MGGTRERDFGRGLARGGRAGLDGGERAGTPGGEKSIQLAEHFADGVAEEEQEQHAHDRPPGAHSGVGLGRLGEGGAGCVFHDGYIE